MSAYGTKRTNYACLVMSTSDPKRTQLGVEEAAVTPVPVLYPLAVHSTSPLRLSW